MNNLFFIEMPQEKMKDRVAIFQKNLPNKQLEFMWVLKRCMFKYN
jgi:hypothetical protein